MKNDKKSKNIIVRILCLVFVFAMSAGLVSPFIAYADSKDDFLEAQKKLDAINEQIAGLNDEEKKLESQKKNANTQMDLVKQQINILKNDIGTLQEDLRKKQEELDAKKIEIEDTDQLFKDRLKAMYIMRSGGNLSTILAVDSFSELLTATDTLQRISVADTDLIKYLSEQKKIIEEEEASIQDSLNELVEKQGTMEDKQSELAGLMQTLDDQLTDTEAKQQAARRDRQVIYEEYQRAKKAVEAEFGESYTDQFVGGEYIWPVPGYGNISSGYGPRSFYIYGTPYSDFHNGIDISGGGIHGRPIVASNSGMVRRAQYGTSGYGNVVEVDHGGGNYTLYGHCSSLAVGVGDYVTQGQVIAYVGNTGFSTGPHLHFGLYTGGGFVDPTPYVSGSRP